MSIQQSQEKIDFSRITNKECTEIVGIPHSRALLRFADAFMGVDVDALVAAREMLAQEMGGEAVGDAAGVVSNFQRMTRLADSTGLALDGVEDEGMKSMVNELSEMLGTNKYLSAENSR